MQCVTSYSNNFSNQPDLITAMENINDSFFDGYYKDVWRAIIPEVLTLREVQFMMDYFSLTPGDKVLDMMCGYGRHALELASRGVQVTAVDNLQDYINEIRTIAASGQLPVEAIQHDVIGYRPGKDFRLVICMGNSLNFFNASDTVTLLKNWANSLSPGTHVLINSWSLAETVIPHFSEKSEASHGGINIISQSKYLFYPSRIETETVMTGPGGTVENRLAVDYIYSVNEIGNFLRAAGFELVEIYNIPGRKKFALGDPRAYIIGRRS